MHSAQDIISTYSQTGARLREAFFQEQAYSLQQAALRLSHSLAHGGKLLVLGKGSGEICARTVAGIFLNRFDLDRPALPALQLSAGGSQGLEGALRQFEALARPGDTLLTFLPCGTEAVSPLLALAQETGLTCLTICGDCSTAPHLPGLVVPLPEGVSAFLVHELLFAVGHLVCRLTDYYLFENVTALQAVDPL